jgi:transposase
MKPGPRPRADAVVVAKMRLAGKTLQAIADHFGVSRQAIPQMIQRSEESPADRETRLREMREYRRASHQPKTTRVQRCSGCSGTDHNYRTCPGAR